MKRMTLLMAAALISLSGFAAPGFAGGVEKQIEIYSFSWGASNPTTSHPTRGPDQLMPTPEIPTGLLMPAIQKVREAAARSTPPTNLVAPQPTPPAVNKLKAPGTRKDPIGLLLPAVQKVR